MEYSFIVIIIITIIIVIIVVVWLRLDHFVRHRTVAGLKIAW